MTSKAHMLGTFAVTSVALFMVTLDNLVVTTALPVIRRELDASLQELEWTINAYTLTFAVLLLTGAALGDRFGRRRVFVIGLGIFTAASAAAALAGSSDELIGARAIQGLGGAIVMPLTLTILSEAVPPERRGVALGAWGGIGGLAVATGPLAGGAIVEGISWQWIFWLNVPVGVLLMPLALVRLKETHGPYARLDLAGLALSGLGLLGIVWGLIRGNEVGWGSSEIMLTIAGGAALRAYAADGLLRQPNVRRSQCRLAADVLRHVRLDLPALAVPADGAGLLAAGRRPADPALDRHADLHRPDGRRPVGPDRRPPADGDRAHLAGGGAGVARLGHDADRELRHARTRLRDLRYRHVAVLRAGRQRRPQHRAAERGGPASGANNAIREAGGVFGVAVLAAVFARYGGYESGQSFVDGLSPAIHGGAGVVLAGALAALAIPRLRRPPKPPEVEPALAVISRCACSSCWGPLVDPHPEATATRAT
jgi:MFS family permease